ncbi:MAG: hypothetical protein ACRERU_06365 [Methylococcales bacterium]
MATWAGNGLGSATALLVLQNLHPVRRDDALDVDVEHLPALVAGVLIIAGRQGSAVDRQDFDGIEIGDLLECRAGMTRLTQDASWEAIVPANELVSGTR